MKLIVGLGNIGDEYKFTRHNIGFLTIDNLINKTGIKLNKEKFNGRFGMGDGFILAKPSTYMNKSGQFIREICDFYKISSSDVMIIYDEKDFKLGQASIKIGGSDAGHNGVKSVIQHLSANDFKRLRIGIGRDPKFELKDWVLSKFTLEDMPIIEKVLSVAADAALSFVYNDINRVIEKFNGTYKK
ncbi:peptidyl-tRNA hydrolase [Mycoplasmopsis californica HAZ160_1]|uniref:Peptidyl-tRNA hydrolase n=1 Tax=Mycoplasmopsis californica HAZ160_1 TaxID=1397850 RepID=A0AAT9F7B0_9BACT|nr:aminoacyl-tRNA hydrolase [Mycoplasmopsis californica]BAP00777.1 peptidyl-tRNA hydrolase [Mycoplasmopsis californica HAZ160_1]BBG40631.1 peptidyl-tRNA hydrolase [Mycoplasmopsis californica]BBG41226.1 peptidyl-tRNA hydrolase [Mycoplasmopsis californica]BBG41819.1 peptidyl-tRNA hydrolase [Mycoplasmopsis californica]BBG42413.1 peptidyl-tRNA hydrolase [Mycoplasmopsis californica]